MTSFTEKIGRYWEATGDDKVATFTLTKGQYCPYDMITMKVFVGDVYKTVDYTICAVRDDEEVELENNFQIKKTDKVIKFYINSFEDKDM